MQQPIVIQEPANDPPNGSISFAIAISDKCFLTGILSFLTTAEDTLGDQPVRNSSPQRASAPPSVEEQQNSPRPSPHVPSPSSHHERLPSPIREVRNDVSTCYLLLTFL